VVYAGGVQFPPVHLGGQTFLPSQANNLYIFPAVGMGSYATNSKRVTDEMFIEAAHTVADQLTPEQLKLGMLFPPQANILEVAVQTAARVAKLIFDCWLGPSRSSDQHGGLDPAARLQAAVCHVCVVN
jgi:malate dehydrogenase (oxaloacetate-decarboxylating)(NADP+)